MSYFNGPRTVTNGMVLCLDAGNIKSFPSTPYYGVFFNGTTRYLSTSRILDSTGDLTIEGWVNISAVQGSNGGYIVSQFVAAGADRTLLVVQSSPAYFSFQVAGTSMTSTTTASLNTWYHVAVARSGSGTNNMSLYVNGTREGQMTYTGSFQNTNTTIGYTPNLVSSAVNGYISNLRIIKGTSLYNSNFTPPSSPLSVITNTVLLTCNNTSIVDASGNYTITNNGSATIVQNNPFVASTIWTDLSGNNNNGTLTNAPYFDSSNGGNILFDGVNDYVTIPNASSLNPTGSLTLCAWFKITGFTSNYGPIIFKQNTKTSFYEQYSLCITSGPNITLLMSTSGGTQKSLSTSYTYGTLTHAVAIFDATNTTTRLYKNGVLANTGVANSTFDVSTEPVLIGAAYKDYIGYSIGNIYYAQIYNRVLSGEEVLQNYNSTRTRFGL